MPKGLEEIAPEGMHPYIPDSPLHQAMAALGLMGLAGGAYQHLLPAEDPRAGMSPRDIRVLPPKREDEMHKAATGDPEADKRMTAGQRFLLGGAAPIGAYGVYKALEHYMERGDRSRLAQQAEYLKRISDPMYKQKMMVAQAKGADPEAMPKTASADPMAALGAALLTKLAEQSIMQDFGEGAAGVGNLALEALKVYPELLGATAGTSALAAYLAAQRNLLPPERMGPPVDLSDPMLVTPRGHYAGRPQMQRA